MAFEDPEIAVLIGSSGLVIYPHIRYEGLDDLVTCTYAMSTSEDRHGEGRAGLGPVVVCKAPGFCGRGVRPWCRDSGHNAGRAGTIEQTTQIEKRLYLL